MVGVQRPVQLFSPLHSGEAGGNTQRRNHWNASNTLRCRTSFSPKHILVPPHHSPFNRQLRRTGQHDVKAVHINLGKLCQGGDNWEMVMVIIMNNFDEFNNHWNHWWFFSSGRPFLWWSRLESCDSRQSRVFPHEGWSGNDGQVVITWKIIWKMVKKH